MRGRFVISMDAVLAVDVCEEEAARFENRVSPELEPVSFLSEETEPLGVAPFVAVDI